MTLEYDYATSTSIRIAEHSMMDADLNFFQRRCTKLRTQTSTGYYVRAVPRQDLATRDDYGSVSGGTGICILGSHERAYEWACEYYEEKEAHELIYGNVD